MVGGGAKVTSSASQGLYMHRDLQDVGGCVARSAGCGCGYASGRPVSQVECLSGGLFLALALSD